MIQIVVTTDENGVVCEESPAVDLEPALLSEPSLAADWNRPEEDEAWSYLQEDPESRPHSCQAKVD
jgi:hypothetical protein